MQLAPPSPASVGNVVDIWEVVEADGVAVMVLLDTGGSFASATAALSKQLNQVVLVTRDELEGMRGTSRRSRRTVGCPVLPRPVSSISKPNDAKKDDRGTYERAYNCPADYLVRGLMFPRSTRCGVCSDRGGASTPEQLRTNHSILSIDCAASECRFN